MNIIDWNYESLLYFNDTRSTYDNFKSETTLF